MKIIFLALILCGLAFASDVIELNAQNFDEIVPTKDLLLVEFYAPWCGHCKHLAPEYEVAATDLAADGIPIAKIDADAEENRDIASRYGIRGYPTLKVFRKGESVDYQGERTAKGIAAFMRKQALPALSILSTVDEIKQFVSKDKVVIVGFFDDKDSQEFKDFSAAAEKFRNKFLFGTSVGSSDANKEYGVEKAPTVILFKKFDEGKNVLSSDKFSELESFITANSVPLIDEIGPENYQSYVDAGLPMGYLFVDLSVSGQMEDYIERLRDIAQNTKGKINWIYIDWTKYSRHAERLGLSGKVVPSLSIDNLETGQHFAFDESKDPTKELITSWVQDYVDGKLEPTIRSEEIPADNSGPVKVVVAKSFDQIVKDPTKDVLVEFYAPWCGHCKQLAPIYEEVGKEYTSSDKVVIAKIDATANDVDPKLNIRGFPTIKFFPAGDKESPIDYDGERTKEAFVTFISQHSTSAEASKGGKDEL